MVHCFKKFCINYDQAIKLIKAKRIVNPNEGFIDQLKQYDKHCNSSTIVPIQLTGIDDNDNNDEIPWFDNTRSYDVSFLNYI